MAEIKKEITLNCLSGSKPNEEWAASPGPSDARDLVRELRKWSDLELAIGEMGSNIKVTVTRQE
jgi:hypothetical protein